MAISLPPRPDMGQLKKRAKERLAELRRRRPAATLADAQLAIARDHGFSSWRALKEHVDAVRAAPAPLPDIAEAVVAEFFEKVGTGDLAAVVAMLRERPALVYAVGPHPFWGGSPQALHVAIDTNRYDMMKLLLQAGADVNGKNEGYQHWSPLLVAIDKSRGRMQRELLKRGARVGLPEALAMGDDVRTMRLLKGGRAALDEATPSGRSLLGFARTTAAIDRLLALGVDTEAEDFWGATPMESLSRMGKKGARLVRHLHGRGVGAPPETFARLGDRRTLARLVAADASVVRNPRVLKAAVDFGHRALVSWLLDRGADVNARGGGQADETCLHSAAWNGDLRMVELLLARGADPNLRDRQYDGTPAGWAETSVEVSNNPECAPVAARLRAAEQR